MIKKRSLFISLLAMLTMLSLAACSLSDIFGQVQSALPEIESAIEDKVQEQIPSTSSVVIPDLSGTWSGTLTENNGKTWDMALVIFHAENSTELTGTLDLSNPESGMLENYSINGTTDGAGIRFSESGGRHFWASVAGAGMEGQAAWDCYDCSENAWASFSLAYGIPSDPMLIFDPTGGWNGTLVETIGDLRTYDMSLSLTREEGTNNFFGEALFTLQGTDTTEFYLVSGYTDGTYIRFNDSGTEMITLYFWGTITEGYIIDGYASRNGFDDPLVAYGTFHIVK